MSADHHAAPDGIALEVLERLWRAATLFQDSLTNPIYKGPQAALQLSVAGAAVDLSDALVAIPESVEPRLPFDAWDGVRRLRRTFRWLIERWGWAGVVRSDGRRYIADREEEGSGKTGARPGDPLFDRRGTPGRARNGWKGSTGTVVRCRTRAAATRAATGAAG